MRNMDVPDAIYPIIKQEILKNCFQLWDQFV